MGGKHQNPRRQLSQSEESWEEQDECAVAKGLSWAAWIRALADREVRRSVKEKR